MIYDSYAYGDPMRVAMRNEAYKQRQENACGQCAHKLTIEFSGKTVNRCGRNKTYGFRCWAFKVVAKTV